MPYKNKKNQKEYGKKYRLENKDKIKQQFHQYRLDGKYKKYYETFKQKHGKLILIKYKIYQKIRIFNKNKPKLLRQLEIFKILVTDEIFNGWMLSDGHLTKIVYKNSRFNFGLIYKNKELVLSTQEHLADLGINSSVKLILKEKPNSHFFILYSEQCKAFTMLRKIWYPNGTKVIPSFIKITPKLLAYHFMGDGTSSWYGKSASVITLCTNAFPFKDTLRLSKMLTELKVDNFIREVHKNRFMIIIKRVKSVEKFYDIVEPYIKQSFMYKIKRHKIDGRTLTRGIHKSPRTEFKKGCIPWNKVK